MDRVFLAPHCPVCTIPQKSARKLYITVLHYIIIEIHVPASLAIAATALEA